VFSLINNGKRSGLAKATAILATGFGISFGLCGLNAIVIDSVQSNGWGFLIVTAYLELAAMIICAVGLLIIAVIAIFRALRRRKSADRESSQP
jgi:uncharacterized membrane protein YidH (DUF202 family)